MKNDFLKIALVLWCLTGGLSASAQTQSFHLTYAIKKQVIDNIADSLMINYVFRDTAIRMAAFIRHRMTQGAYDTVNTPGIFASYLQKDLRGIYSDGHLKVSYDANISQNEATQDDEVRKQAEERDRQFKKVMNLGFHKAELLTGNIGYLDIRLFFSPDQDVKEMVSAALRLVSNSDVLIIDLRMNMGGDPETIQYLCNFLFKKPTHLNDLYSRVSDITYQSWTKPDSTYKNLQSIPIYILTSHFTFSGGEELSYDLQSQKRALIVGEVTGGGAHPVRPYAAGSGFVIGIPFSRAINPITHTNWESIGVKPDFQVSADKALETALEQIKKRTDLPKSKNPDETPLGTTLQIHRF